MLLRLSFLFAAAPVAEIGGAFLIWRGWRVGVSPGEEAATRVLAPARYEEQQ